MGGGFCALVSNFVSCDMTFTFFVKCVYYNRVTQGVNQGQGFSSVVPLPALQMPGPVFDPWYPPKINKQIKSQPRHRLSLPSGSCSVH